MISNTLKINAIILFAVVLAASGGALIKQKTKIVDNYTNLKSNPLLSDINMYPQLKFHPHSKHYIYNFDTVEDTDKREFKDLASKLSQLPSNFPSKIILTTVSAPSVASSTDLNTGNPLTNRELYLISKYWLQLLPQLHPELLKCLAGPTAKSSSKEDQFPSNCPSEILYLKQNTEESSSPTTITNPSFNIPYTLYSKLQKCSNLQCQEESKDCYCTNNPCTDCTDPNSCKCFDISKLTIGPRFFTPGSIPSNFYYPSPPSSQAKPIPKPTFNATGTSKPQNPKSLPHFSFPLPHSSYTTPKTQNSSSPIHWPQKITIQTNFIVTLNGTESNSAGHRSLEDLVSKLLNSPSSFKTYSPLKPHSPTQLFFVRYIATLYALLWSYSPDSLPLFPSNSTRDILSEHDIPSSSNTPFYYTHPLSSNPTT